MMKNKEKYTLGRLVLASILLLGIVLSMGVFSWQKITSSRVDNLWQKRLDVDEEKLKQNATVVMGEVGEDIFAEKSVNIADEKVKENTNMVQSIAKDNVENDKVISKMQSNANNLEKNEENTVVESDIGESKEVLAQNVDVSAEFNNDVEAIAEVDSSVSYNPLEFSDFIQPVNVDENYGYGFGYDEKYKDVRFHNCVFYKMDEDTAVVAVNDGVVESISTTKDGVELVILHDNLKSVLSNLKTCELNVGDKVKKGQMVGVAQELYFMLEE